MPNRSLIVSVFTPQIVLRAVKQRGITLGYADDSLRKNKEIVLAAVKQDGDDLQKDEKFSQCYYR